MENLQSNKTITLDFCKDELKVINVKQYDEKSRYLTIKCMDNGKFVKLDNYVSCSIKMMTPDSRAIFNTCEITEEGYVLVEFTESMLYASGIGKAEIKIVNQSKQSVLSTMSFEVIIKASVYSDDTIIASDEFNALNDLLIHVDEKVDDALEVADKIIEIGGSVDKIQQQIEQSKQDALDAADAANNAKQTALEMVEHIGEVDSTASASADAAKESEINAKASEANALNSANEASIKASEASNSANEATDQATLSKSYAVGGTGIRDGEDVDNSKYYSEQASTSASTATTKAEESLVNANSAQTSAMTANEQATLATSYAVGGTDSRDGEDTDNSKYYAEQAKNSAQDIEDVLTQAERYAKEAKDAADKADSVTKVDIATDTTPGLVKGGGNVHIEEDGTITVTGTEGLEEIKKTVEGLDIKVGEVEKDINDKIWSQDITNSITELSESIQDTYVDNETFNNKMGTTDISTIGDGTVYGAIDYLKRHGGGGGSSEIIIMTDTEIVLSQGSWVANSDYGSAYSLTVTVNGIEVDSNPIIGQIFANGVVGTDDELEAYSHIIGWKCAYNAITFYSDELPSMNLNVLVKGTVVENPFTDIEYNALVNRISNVEGNYINSNKVITSHEEFSTTTDDSYIPSVTAVNDALGQLNNNLVNLLFDKFGITATSNPMTASAKTWVYTGIKISVPKGKNALVSVMGTYNISRPLGIALIQSSTSYKSPYAFNEQNSDFNVLSLNCAYLKESGDYYVWTKREQSLQGSTENFYIRGIYF